jgi:hypothetical protein
MKSAPPELKEAKRGLGKIDPKKPLGSLSPRYHRLIFPQNVSTNS